MRLFRSRTHHQERPSGYLCSDTDLYWIVHTSGERVLLEDCRTEVLLDVPISYLALLRPIDRTRACTTVDSPRALSHA